MRRALRVVVIGSAVLAAATAVRAQDVEVRIKIDPQVGREISRIIQRDVVQDLVPDIQREIRGAMRDLGPIMRDLTPLLRDIADAARPSIEVLQNRGGDFRFEQKKVETKTLALGATGALDLENQGGDIIV